MFFQTMYNVVDSIWAGQISTSPTSGTSALAALGLSFPVFLLIIATGGGLVTRLIGFDLKRHRCRRSAQTTTLRNAGVIGRDRGIGLVDGGRDLAS